MELEQKTFFGPFLCFRLTLFEGLGKKSENFDKSTQNSRIFHLTQMTIYTFFFDIFFFHVLY